jgi:elongation factor Ts
MEQIKKLREETGAGVMDAKKALEESAGEMKKAKAWIAKKGLARAEKKAGRETKAGVIYAYTHHNNLTASMVELLCETDFVASNAEFSTLAKELAMQVNSMQPKNVAEFLGQEYVRDPKLTVEQLIKQVAGKLGENVVLARFVRFEVGK